MKTWKWRSSRLINKAKSGGFAFPSGLLQYRIYPKGRMSSRSKFYELTLKAKSEKVKWITAHGFSLKEAFQSLREEIKNNNWNVLEE